MSFVLDGRLERDTLLAGDLPLSGVLLMNDARWPWLILAPRRAGAVEVTDLEAADRALLIEEAALAASFLKRHTDPIGALGIVLQVHLHVVARMTGDPAWPGPVWGFGAAVAYEENEARALIAAARKGLGL